MAEFLISESFEYEARDLLGRRVVLNDGGDYWFLYSYFEAASLPPRSHELIDLYSDTELSGYQLQRFIDELEEAKTDAANKPESWDVLVGWNGETMSKETELMVRVERADILNLIGELLSLAKEARDRGLKLILIGD